VGFAWTANSKTAPVVVIQAWTAPPDLVPQPPWKSERVWFARAARKGPPLWRMTRGSLFAPVNPRARRVSTTPCAKAECVSPILAGRACKKTSSPAKMTGIVVRGLVGAGRRAKMSAVRQGTPWCTMATGTASNCRRMRLAFKTECAKARCVGYRHGRPPRAAYAVRRIPP